MVWRNNRIEDRSSSSARRPQAPAAPQEMVRCAVCGLHLPQPDAVRGAGGVYYCSQEHRLRAGG
jgi:uncharacterized protein